MQRMKVVSENPRANRCLIAIIAVALLAVGALAPGCSAQAQKQSVQSDQESALGSAQDTVKKADTASASAAAVDATRTQAAVQAAIDASGLQASVAYIDLTSGKGYSIGGSTARVSASVIKLVILNELLQQVADGTLSLDEQITVASGDVVGGTGVIQDMAMPATLTLSDLAVYMIDESDNTATNIIIDKVGMDAVNARAAKLGLTGSHLNRYMMDEAAMQAGIENYISADDAAKLLQMAYTGTFVNAPMSAFALDALKQQNIQEGIKDGVPGDILVAHKTGSLGTIENDAAIVYASSPYILTVMTDGGSSQQDFALMKTISETVYSGR